MVSETRGTMKDVVVCALTYRRPEGLARLLRALAQLTVPEAAGDLGIVIVDNDPDGSGGAVVEAHRATVPFPIHYCVEPRRGIATARNRAIAEAGDTSIVVFIDDDEWPEPDWLVQLLATMERTGADVVTGPVLPVFEDGAPGWVIRGGFFDRPRFADGAPISWATSSSVAIRTSVLGDDPFDARFNLTGGEDTHLFQRLRLAGASIVWADHAVVHELIPTTRTTPSWLIRRQYRRGQTLSTCLVLLEDGMARKCKRLLRATVEVGSGLAIAATSVVKGRVAVVRGAQRVAFGSGLVTGLFGAHTVEYATVHGR